MEKEININETYIGLEEKEDYSDFLEEYELWTDHVLLEKTSFGLKIDTTAIEIYKDISNDKKLYMRKDGIVLNSKDELTGEDRYHKISNIISIKELLDRFENEEREECQYRRYVMPIYEKILDVLNGKNTIDLKELKKIFGKINDIHTYVFKLITEEEFEDLFGCRTYDFDTGNRIRK